MLREGQPWLALKGAVLPLAMLGCAALIRWRRHVYLRHREPLQSLVVLVAAWSGLVGALEGSCGEFNLHRRHGDSAALLLFLMTLHNGTISLLAFTLYSRPALRWELAALPLISLLPILRGEAYCDKVLEAEGVEGPMELLFHVLVTFK